MKFLENFVELKRIHERTQRGGGLVFETQYKWNPFEK